MIWGWFAKTIGNTFDEWKNDKTLKLGASLSYYTVFSLPAVLLIAIETAGLIFGAKAARSEVVAEFEGLLGKDGAQIIQTMIEGAGKSRGGLLASLIGIASLVFGATGAFTELQDSLNIIWKVKPKPDTGIAYTIRIRVIALLVVLGFGFFLLVSLVISALLSAYGKFLLGFFSGPSLITWILHIINFAVSLGIFTLLIAMIYKLLPDAEIQWRDVWLGSMVTAILFTAGKFLIGFYLGRTTIASYYGAAGSLAIILLWVYYSSQILYFGAEFTQVYANRYGSKIVPKEHAVRAAGPIPQEPEVPPSKPLRKKEG